MVTRVDQVLGAVPAFANGVLNWGYVIFILNRYRGVCAFSKAELIALLLYIYGGYAAWIAEMCILREEMIVLQVAASLFRTCLQWLGMLLIVNEQLYATPQQLGSLAFVATIASLWEVQHRLMLN